MTKSGSTDEALQSFESLKGRLDGIKTLVQPSADPHSAAVTALLVADFLAHGEMKEKLVAAKKGSDESIVELRTLARAILHCLTQLGGDWFPLEGKAPPLGALKDEGATQRAKLVSALESKLKDENLRAIVASIKKGEGDVDLVLDLRALATLAELHAADAPNAKEDISNARSLADKAEAKLAESDPPGHAEWRGHVVRAWTLFAPAYEALCAAARELSGEGVESVKFPPLFTVSRARRTRKRASIAPAANQDPVSRRSGAPPAPSIRAGAAGVDVAPVSIGDGISRRTSPRHAVEMEVGIASESNFYVGFTENLSASGVFIATYSHKPIGAKIEVTLTFPNGAQIKVPGTVRWIRDATPSGDSWPGMGVQFEKLTSEQEQDIRNFLRFRDPLFFDDE